jgi:hypothetical protein
MAGVVFIAVLVLVVMGIRYIFYRGVDTVSDSIKNMVDQKRGKMEETESESLADRFKNN